MHMRLILLLVTNLMDPKSHCDAMSRSDAAQWQNALKVEMDGLYARNVFSVVDPPDYQTIYALQQCIRPREMLLAGMLRIKLDFVCEEINKRRGMIISNTKHKVQCSIVVRLA